VKILVFSLLAGSVLFFPVAHPEPKIPSGPGISVVTLNMAKVTLMDRILTDLKAHPALAGADVLLLQEVKQDAGERQCIAEQLASNLGLQVAYSPSATGITDQGLAILSRYPLKDIRVRPLKRHDLGFRSRVRIALSATAESPWGPVRIVNTHLDTRINMSDRIAQIEPIIRDSEEFPGARIIGGDFNSNDFRWIGHMVPTPTLRSQARGLQEFMTQQGFLSAVSTRETTFDYLGLRLDWIWIQGLQAQASRVYPLDFSDHHAVWTRVAFAPRTEDLQPAMNRIMKGRAGTAVALDVDSGKIVAKYHLEVAARRLARPGSVIKPFTLLALPARTLLCPGKLQIGPRQMDCTHPPAGTAFDAVSALAYSCNNYFAAAAAGLRNVDLIETFTRAGLVSRTGLYDGEAVGELIPPTTVEARQLLALGESNIMVTPLAIVSAYRKLALMKKSTVFEGLEAATEYGTARLAQPPGMKVAGKTGTASDPRGGNVHAWFAGYAPAHAPRVALVVFLEQGVGGRDAAPVAAELFPLAR